MVIKYSGDCQARLGLAVINGDGVGLGTWSFGLSIGVTLGLAWG